MIELSVPMFFRIGSGIQSRKPHIGLYFPEDGMGYYMWEPFQSHRRWDFHAEELYIACLYDTTAVVGVRI